MISAREQHGSATSEGMQPVIWLQHLSKNDGPVAGGKGANLGELLRAGLPVPPGVVAREYGIPAVVGVPASTQQLRTGQRVRVDGERGQVIPP